MATLQQQGNKLLITEAQQQVIINTDKMKL